MHDTHQLEPGGTGETLSERQYEVLGLLTHGMTNARIAGELGISLDGAKWHVSELLGALRVDTRQEAARWYRTRATWRPDVSG